MTGHTKPNRKKLAEALRMFSAEIVSCDTDDAVFSEMAATIEDFTRILKNTPRRIRKIESPPINNVHWRGSSFHFGDMLDFSPLSGDCNPIAPHMTVFTEDRNQVLGHVNFPAAFEGPPGFVHGGFIAAAFDELLGLTQSVTGHFGMTGTLTVKFRKPCPIKTELQMTGIVRGEDGRKIFTEATLKNGDELIAEGEAVFIRL